jgi:1-acyl-sn-glycerol-3-phosphate acyltransferase
MTACVYLTFGAGFLVFALLLIVLRLSIHDADRRGRLARATLSDMAGHFFRISRLVGVLNSDVSAEGDLPTGRLPAARGVLVANHPTILDALLILSVIPECICIVKTSLTSIPGLSFIINIMQYLTNEDAATLLSSGPAHLAAGKSLLIFPEGTRTRNGQLGRFSRGAAALAIRSKAPIWPVIVRCSPPAALEKGGLWWKMPDGPIDLKIRICYPLDLHSTLQNPQDERGSEITATRFLEEFFAVRISGE